MYIRNIVAIGHVVSQVLSGGFEILFDQALTSAGLLGNSGQLYTAAIA
jgi:hypothetical protein